VAPYSVATDSTHRVFVADPDAGVVHVFDFEQSKYAILKGRGLASHHDSHGRFLHYLGKVEGGETYFQAPKGIAVDAATSHIYVCDSRRHMIIMLDKKAHILVTSVNDRAEMGRESSDILRGLCSLAMNSSSSTLAIPGSRFWILAGIFDERSN
jgi:hypothetical protein